MISTKSEFTRRYMKALAWLGASLFIFNFAFISSSGWARFFWAILGYGVLVLVCKTSKLTLSDIGLETNRIVSGIKYAAPIVGLIFIGFLLTFWISESTFNDPRYHQDLSTALFAAIVLLPLKIVFFEELTFRGILPALLFKLKNNRRYVTLLSSLLFGLWHILPIAVASNHTLTGSVTAPKFITLIITFLATTIAGIIFYELRWRSKSLVAPIIVHWFINASSMIFAALSWT